MQPELRATTVEEEDFGIRKKVALRPLPIFCDIKVLTKSVLL